MNMTGYIYRDRLFVVDCGLRFSDPSKLGTDALIPAVDRWFAEFSKVAAYVITHGHEDHIGALPYIIERWPAPIYATKWTIELIKNKFARMGIDPSRHTINEVAPNDIVKLHDFEVEYLHVNHSIPSACALLVRAGDNRVFHTGDFKFDFSATHEPPLSRERLANIGRVDLLLADSTNADKDGMCPSEQSVLEPLKGVIEGSKGAVIVTTFASNLWRLKVVIELALSTGRKLFVTGSGMESTLLIAARLGMLQIPQQVIVTDTQLKSVARKDLLVLASGCQGEFRSALARIAYSEHRDIKIYPGDMVVFSSRIIPGNERSILGIVDQLKKQGADVVTPKEVPGIHVSGHAYGGDLAALATTLQPSFYAPIHGSYGHLHANRQRFSQYGLRQEQVVLIENGDVIDIEAGRVTKVAGPIFEYEYIDSDSYAIISQEVLRERLRIGERGAALVTGVFALSSSRWLAPPEIELIGLAFPWHTNQSTWIDEQKRQVRDLISGYSRKSGVDKETLAEEVRVSLRRALTAALKKKPVVIVKVHFVQA